MSSLSAAIFFIYNIQWFFTLEMVYVKRLNWTRCQIVNAPEFLKLHWRDIDAAIASYIPMGLMLVFNLAIITLLWRNRRTNLSIGATSKDMSKIAKQVTLMLLAVTWVFIILKSPVAIYLHIVGIHIRKYPVTMSTLTNFVYINSSINSFLYMLSGSKYRERAIAMFICSWKRNVKKSCKETSITEKETEGQTI